MDATSSLPDGRFPELFFDEDVAPARVSARKSVEEAPFITIERDYPRVAKSIELLWGHVELDQYLQKLIIADRGDREGFPKTALVALLKLYKQHASQFGFSRASDEWAHDPLAKHAHRENRPKKTSA
jgi:hypothetical protein